MTNETKDPTVEVKTAFIHSIGYNPLKEVIVVKLTSGDIETFYNNSIEEYTEFFNAKDKDKHMLNVLEPKRKEGRAKVYGVASELNR